MRIGNKGMILGEKVFLINGKNRELNKNIISDMQIGILKFLNISSE
jgi:hypothetical protein